MAGRRKSRSRTAKRARAKVKRPYQPSSGLRKKTEDSVGPGYDFGAAGLNLSIANTYFSEQLFKAKTWGCAYGLLPPGRIPYTSPILSLIGERKQPLVAALNTMREWTKVGGPGAINLEIAFSGQGYVLSISQDSRSLAWRTLGFGNVQLATTLNLSWGKRMDTRQPFLERLADYAKAPFAPLHLYVGKGSMTAPDRIEMIDDCEPILLERIWVYRSEEEIPDHSPLGAMIGVFGEGRAEPIRTREQPPKALTPQKVLEERDKVLFALTPKTMLVLRHREDGQRLVAQAIEQGYSRWQAEQALVNLRLSEIAELSPPIERGEALKILRQSYAEYGGQPYALAEITPAKVLEQIEADLEYLLKAVSEDVVPEGISERMQMLRKLGYV